MNHAPVRTLSFCALAALGLATSFSLGSPAGHPQDALPADAARAANQAATQSERPWGRWRAFGRVTDQDGRPIAAVDVSAHCGAGTLRRTGVATSGDDGRYELTFGPGVLFAGGDGTSLQAATITAHKPGYFEENLNRQGGCLAADTAPGEKEIKSWGGRKDRVFLADRALELNFVMRPAGRVAGTLINEQG